MKKIWCYVIAIILGISAVTLPSFAAETVGLGWYELDEREFHDQDTDTIVNTGKFNVTGGFYSKSDGDSVQFVAVDFRTYSVRYYYDDGTYETVWHVDSGWADEEYMYIYLNQNQTGWTADQVALWNDYALAEQTSETNATVNLHVPKINYAISGDVYYNITYEKQVLEFTLDEVNNIVFSVNVIERRTTEFVDATVNVAFYNTSDYQGTLRQYSYNTTDRNLMPRGVKLRENGVITEFERVEETLADYTYIYYSYSYKVPVEQGKNFVKDFWLYTPANEFNYEEYQKEQQDKIQNLIDKYGNVNFENVNISMAFGVIDPVLKGLGFVGVAVPAVLSIALVGFILFGKR